MVVKTLTAGLLSAPLLFNSPGGHQLLHEVGLRVAFDDALEYAREIEEQPDMRFSEFRTFAAFYLDQYFGEDDQSFANAMSLLAVSLCLPSDGEEPSPYNYATGCHAGVRQEEELDSNNPTPLGA